MRAREANVFLREIAGVNISLKDFRTLIASASILEMLARVKPARSERQRRKQVLRRSASPPTICTTRRRSAAAATCTAR